MYCNDERTFVIPSDRGRALIPIDYYLVYVMSAAAALATLIHMSLNNFGKTMSTLATGGG